MLGRAFGRERKDGNARLDACDVAGGAGGGNCNLSQFWSGRIRNDSAVGENQNAVSAVRHAFGQKHYKCAGNDIDAGHSLDHLESSTQHIAGSVHGASNLTVGISCLHHKATEIEGVVGCKTGFLHRDTFALAELMEQRSIFVDDFFVGGVDNSSLADIRKLHRVGQSIDVGRIADEDDVGQPVGYDSVGGS